MRQKDLAIVAVLIVGVYVVWLAYTADLSSVIPGNIKTAPAAPRVVTAVAAPGEEESATIDPVNEPDYNMRNIAKQSILLEEHLAEDKKYCKSCITKHFLHIIGLAEEATWMAGSKVDDYPFLRKSVGFYQRTFDTWLADRVDPKVRCAVLEKLRAARRELIGAYYLKSA
jgi:hypothetical protein